MSYDAHVGLTLNQDRQGLRGAWRIKQGVEWALSKGRIPRKVFDAITSSPAEAESLEFAVNKSRREAAAFATLGAGLPGRVVRQ